MRILVTGGAGFIASHVVDKYIELGHQVAVIDNLSTGKKEFVNSQAVFYQEDIRHSEALNRIFSQFKPEIINHHAAQIDVRKSVVNPTLDAQINILGLINLLESGRKVNLRQVIFASSGGAIYGDTEFLPTPESVWPKPASAYGVSKLTSEYYLDYYRQTYGINFMALRYGNVYGPRQNPYGEAGVVAIFIEKLLNNITPVINGNGLQTRDFVFVDDVVEANIKALGKSESMILNIGTGVSTSINDLFNLVSSIMNSQIKKVHGRAKPGEQQRSLLETKLAKLKLNWIYKTVLKTGLKKTQKYFQNEKNKK